MKYILFLVALLGSALATNAVAEEFSKKTHIVKISAEDKRPAYTYVEDKNFIVLEDESQWPGDDSNTCNGRALIIPDNSLMSSIALAALMSGKEVEVVIDNTLPKAGAYCTAAVLTIIN